MNQSDWWTPLKVTGWDAFVQLASRFGSIARHSPPYLYRGQSDSRWALTTSLERLLRPDTDSAEALRVEAIALNEFRAVVHLHQRTHPLPAVMEGFGVTEWWALMQHHGAPTRLIDWTASAYVAAYFAVESLPDSDGSVFVVHPRSVNEQLRAFMNGKKSAPDEYFLKPDAHRGIYFFSPSPKSERLAAQQGHFSASFNVRASQDELLCEACNTAGTSNPEVVVARKWIIPAPLKPIFLRQLRSMNIAAHSLFPGIDGLGRSIAEVVRGEQEPVTRLSAI